MAAVAYKFTDVGKNVKCSASLRLKCGHWINESVTASSAKVAKENVQEFMKLRIQSHECDK